MLLSTLVAGAGAVMAWLAWESVGDVVAEAVGLFLRPITRPAWRVIVAARSPWPLWIAELTGAAAFVVGLRLMGMTGWPAGVGGVLFFMGAAVILIAPFLCRDSRIIAAQTAAERSRPVV
jgi:ABC-type multidrug transport system fused ATPase/permease subunit